MKHLYKIVFTALIIAFCNTLMAQVQDPSSPGYDENYPDSSETEATEVKKDAPLNPFLKPYERIKLPFDSITNLITYEDVIEQEESGSDSLYIRAKRWADKTFGKGYKLELDKRNQKLIYVATIPAYTYNNVYNKRQYGTYEMKFYVLIKEGRYKYQINNLVYESPKPSSGGKSTRNYFEYFYTTNTNVQISDKFLRYADKDIREMITGFKKAMAEPIIVDEDDW